MSKFFGLLICLTALVFALPLWAAPTNGFCKNFQLADVPVGNFHQPMRLPESTLRVTQGYNTTLAEGYCLVGNSQPSGNSPACAGHTIYYGHDGLDMHPQGAVAGQTDIHAVENGIVVASHPSGSFTGWGESIIIAVRTNNYSEELLTFHYHHLYFNNAANVTSRLVGACDTVGIGDVIAKEGGTPDWPTHLHFTIKHWHNLKELQDKIKQSPSIFYGYGYTFGDNSKIANFLDPRGVLLDTFVELDEHQTDFADWTWSYPYLREMRAEGWFFGNFDGNFGITEEVKRREAARWIKQAMRLDSAVPSVAHFSDVPLSDVDSPYLEALLKQNVSIKVISPDHSCTSTGLNFCPDQSLTRAEALKMIITGFYQNEFIDLYNNWVWQAASPLANNLLSHFADVSPYSWYAPYIYFAWQNGLSGGGAIFNPDLPIKRAELAKWLVIGAEHHFGSNSDFCATVQCAPGNYCDQTSHNCQPIPTCLPSENQDCPLGGGYDTSSENTTGSSGGGGSSNTSQNCTAGQDEFQLCPNNQTASYRVCLNSGEWSEWNPPCPQPNDEGSGGASGAASSSSSGVNQCTTSFHLSPAAASCNSNPQSSGSPTLCLETQLSTGPNLSWRLCKENGAFQNSFSYELLDQNHLSHFLGGAQNGTSGQVCSSWHNNDFSYINQDSPQYGAGLIIEVHSPSGCTSSSCTYYTGITTLYRECEN